MWLILMKKGKHSAVNVFLTKSVEFCRDYTPTKSKLSSSGQLAESLDKFIDQIISLL